MLLKNKIMQVSIICVLMVTLVSTTMQGQTKPPTWWFGVSGAANLNMYNGTTQRLDNTLIIPTAFHRGIGVRPAGSFMIDYRPGRIWGGMLNIGYDGRGGRFKDKEAPCNCPATLKTKTMSYIAVEPSIRLGSATSNFYFFAGPRLGFNLQKDFSYTQLKQPDAEGDFSSVRKVLVSGQFGVGYDWDVSAPASGTRISLSPFFAYHPYFGQNPRDIESWTMTTVRVGMALKFGKGAKVSGAGRPVTMIPVNPVQDVVFSELKTVNTPPQESSL